MTGNETASNDSTENDSAHTYVRYAIKHTFGVVHAVLLTLISFGISSFSFSLLGYFILPLVSLALTFICSASVQYVCDGAIHIPAILRKLWIPPLGVFSISLIILPLEMMRSTGIGPLSTLVATSFLMNAIAVWILQVYSSPDDSELSPPPLVSEGGVFPT
jgi:hypothetical protein